MKALILAWGGEESCPGGAKLGPGALAPVAGKPLVHHIVEHLVLSGVTRIEFLTEYLHQDLLGLLGDGTRWGAQIVVHDVDEAVMAAQVRSLATESPGEGLLLGRADVLPRLTGVLDKTPEVPVFLRLSQKQRSLRVGQRWTGWASLPPGFLGECSEDVEPGSVLELLMPGGVLVGRWETSTATLDSRDPEALLRANRTALDGTFPELVLGAVEVAPGIWFGPRVQVAEDVILEAPVFLGEETVVETGARLGPGCSVGDRAILDAGVEVQDSVVLRGTYVGRGLRLREAIAGGNWLSSVRHGTTVEVEDESLLADLNIPVVTRVLHCLSRNLSRVRSHFYGLEVQ